MTARPKAWHEGPAVSQIVYSASDVKPNHRVLGGLVREGERLFVLSERGCRWRRAGEGRAVTHDATRFVPETEPGTFCGAGAKGTAGGRRLKTDPTAEGGERLSPHLRGRGAQEGSWRQPSGRLETEEFGGFEL